MQDHIHSAAMYTVTCFIEFWLQVSTICPETFTFAHSAEARPHVIEKPQTRSQKRVLAFARPGTLLFFFTLSATLH